MDAKIEQVTEYFRKHKVAVISSVIKDCNLLEDRLDASKVMHRVCNLGIVYKDSDVYKYIDTSDCKPTPKPINAKFINTSVISKNNEETRSFPQAVVKHIPSIKSIPEITTAAIVETESKINDFSELGTILNFNNNVEKIKEDIKTEVQNNVASKNIDIKPYGCGLLNKNTAEGKIAFFLFYIKQTLSAAELAALLKTKYQNVYVYLLRLEDKKYVQRINIAGKRAVAFRFNYEYTYPFSIKQLSDIEIIPEEYRNPDYKVELGLASPVKSKHDSILVRFIDDEISFSKQCIEKYEQKIKELVIERNKIIGEMTCNQQDQ